ncbi:hypothetical protein [Caudoviricetes sp.]|nr:hypothetical protein [Caudoviricetes sp.]
MRGEGVTGSTLTVMLLEERVRGPQTPYWRSP